MRTKQNKQTGLLYLPIILVWDRVVFNLVLKANINASAFGEKPEKNGSQNV